MYLHTCALDGLIKIDCKIKSVFCLSFWPQRFVFLEEMIISGSNKIMHQKLPVIQVFLVKLIKKFIIMMVDLKSSVPNTLTVKNQCSPCVWVEVTGRGLRWWLGLASCVHRPVKGRASADWREYCSVLELGQYSEYDPWDSSYWQDNSDENSLFLEDTGSWNG